MTNKILRLPEVKNLTGLPCSTIYLKISKGLFPKQISLGARSVGWTEKSIESWITKQINETKNSYKGT